MREQFREWYSPNDDDLKEFVTAGKIVLDANVLLDLYRYSAAMRARLLDELSRDQIRPRLFLPYQSGFEYHRNRLKVATDHEDHYNAVLAAVDALGQGVTKAAEQLRDEHVHAALTKQFNKAIRKAQKSIRDAVVAEQELNVIPAADLRVQDPIRDRIEELLTDQGQVGNAPEPDVAATWTKDWEAAADLPDDMKPPGYKDGKKKDNGHGDYFIWQEMKGLASISDSPVLFVSGDDKADWMDRFRGRTVGPRTHLRAEFYRATGQAFHKISWPGFLNLLNEHLDSRIEQQIIEAAKAPQDNGQPTLPSSVTLKDLLDSGHGSDRPNRLAEFLAAMKNDQSEIEITLARHLLSAAGSDKTRSALADLLTATGPHETSSAFERLRKTRPQSLDSSAEDAIRQLREAQRGPERLPFDLPSDHEDPDLFDD